MAVEIGQPFLRRQHRVHADRRLLVAFALLLDAILAEADVEIGDVARTPEVVRVDEEARARCVDDERVRLGGRELQQGSGKVIDARRVEVAREAHARLVLQRRQRIRVERGRGEGDRLPGARHEQVAPDQVAEAEIGIAREHLVDLAQRLLQAHLAQAHDGADEIRFRVVTECGPAEGAAAAAVGERGRRRREGDECETLAATQRGAEARAQNHPPARSCLMSQRSPDFTSLSVLVLLLLSVSER